MNIETITLFVACILFSFFNFYENTKTNSHMLKIMTFFLGITGILGAGYLLLVSFINYMK